jgi:hypothetical protein
MKQLIATKLTNTVHYEEIKFNTTTKEFEYQELFFNAPDNKKIKYLSADDVTYRLSKGGFTIKEKAIKKHLPEYIF